MLEWIIPSDTFARLTPADCLMVTLASYFHDLGMLVTRDEFDRRAESKFGEFKESIFEGNEGKDYRDRVSKMPEDEAVFASLPPCHLALGANKKRKAKKKLIGTRGN